MSGAGARAPARWTERAVALAVRRLPAGPRQRYRKEFVAELHGMPQAQQLRHVAGLLIRTRALRGAVVGSMPDAADQVIPPRLGGLVLCRTGIRHRWRRLLTDDGQPYCRCERCGKDMLFYPTRWEAGIR